MSWIMGWGNVAEAALQLLCCKHEAYSLHQQNTNCQASFLLACLVCSQLLFYELLLCGAFLLVLICHSSASLNKDMMIVIASMLS